MTIRRLFVMLAASAAATTSAGAQDAAPPATEVELPPIVVEGATIEAKHAIKKKSKPASVFVEEDAEPSPAPSPKPKAKKSVAKAQSAPKPAKPASSPPADPQPEPAIDNVPSAADQPASSQASVPGLPAEKIGSSVTVVTAEQLKAQQVRNGAEALRSLPGVSVSQQGGAQGVTVVRLRGAESNHTLVLIDGVEVNAAGTDGFFDFSTLLVDDIQQIEVLRGPQSSLYSSGAIGGVINVITRGGKGPLTIRARAEGGSFDTRDGMVGISGGTDRGHMSFTASGRRTNGFNISATGTEDDGAEFSTLSFTGGILVFENLKLDATLRRAHREGDRDGTNDTRDGLFVASEEFSTFASDVWLGRAEATLDTFGGAWIHKLFVSGIETDNSDFDRGPFSPPAGQFSRNISTTSKYGYLSTYRLDGAPSTPVTHFFTGLVEHQREQFEQPLLSSEAFERDRDSIAGEIRGEYFNVLTLTGNVRHDQNDGFDNFTTWRTAGSLRPEGSPVRLHASVGTAVKYPSFSEQFGVFSGFVANPNLTSESSLGWDAGVETTLFGGKAIFDVTYFNANLENEIDFNFVPPVQACGGVPFCFIPFNRTGESKREGIEVSGRAILADGLSVGLAYTYLRAREENGEMEVRRAPHSGRFDINYAFDGGKGKVNLAAIYNGEMEDLAFSALTFSSQRVKLDSYGVINATASYKVAPGVELYGRVENLLDKEYQEIFGFETAGLAAYGGVRITYEEPSTLSWSQYK